MVGNGDVAAETHQVLKNLVAVLKQAGATLRVDPVFLADLGDFQTVNGVYAEAVTGSAQPEPAFKWQLCQRITGGNRLCPWLNS